MCNWYDDYNDDEIVVLKGILTPFMSQAKSVQVTLAAAHKADDLIVLRDNGVWTSKPPGFPLGQGRIYRIRTDFKRPVVGWWTGMGPNEVDELKSNARPFGLCSPWHRNAIKAFKKSGDAVMYLCTDRWTSSDVSTSPTNNITYRLRADWTMP